MTDEQQNKIHIAVTGHRLIDPEVDVSASIHAVFAQIFQDHPGADFYLLSALAEGSDQLVAWSAQKYPEVKLLVPLPLPEEKYLLDFQTDEGRKNFVLLSKTAEQVFTLSKISELDSPYDHLGSYLSDKCHVLIALWNGEYSGKIGGTGEVVKKILNAGKPVYWIYSDNLIEDAVNSLNQVYKIGEIIVLNKQSR